MYNGSAMGPMDSIGKIFAAIDGAVPENPFRSFTSRLSDGRMCAAAAGNIHTGCYVAYLEEPRDTDGENVVGETFVDENVELAALEDPQENQEESSLHVRFRVRYLEYFPEPFKAGERYQFFREALNPTPEEDSTDEEMERDHLRGRSRIEDFITGRINRSLIDEFLHAEEVLENSGDSAFWEQARLTAHEELLKRVPHTTLEKDLDLHRFRRAALRENEEYDEEN